MNRRVVVTGGCGYIGSHVARAFKMNGDEVLIIDRVRREHTLKDIDGYYIGDFSDDDSLATMVDYHPDVVVHCAGTSLVGPSMSNPSEYYNNNIAKTIKMMDVVKDLDKRPVIMFSSSASVYGEPDVLPLKEYDEIKPISPYGNTKSAGEMILKDYGNAYGIDVMCFRYFNAAGAVPITHDLGQEPEATHIVARVLEASINNRAFTINGSDFDTPDGTCIRDYVHVWDIALAHVRAAGYFANYSPRIYKQERTAITLSLNLGTNEGVSNKEIVDYVVKKYGLPFVNYGDARPGDPAELVADATKARELLGWEPVNSKINTIIDTAYEWYTRQKL
jgi:UDP-glucose-4-epimerase GalE